jgi:triphosphatase
MTATSAIQPDHTSPRRPAWAAPAPALVPHLHSSLKKDWRDHQRRIKRCQNDFSEKAVHQTRVATRRLLSLVELLGSLISGRSWKKARRALKRYLGHFGDLRDAHVQLQTVNSLSKELPELEGFRAALLRQEQRHAKKARTKVNGTRLRRLGKWIDELKDDLAQTSKKVSPEKLAGRALAGLDKAFLKVVKSRRQIDPGDSATIHRTRLAFKKFRYTAEVLSPLLRDMDERKLEAMNQYQSMLGKVQDAEVLLAGAERFLQKQKARRATVLRIRSELSRRRLELVEAALKKADDLYRFWPMARRKSS